MIVVSPGSLYRVAIAVYAKTSFYTQQTSRVPFLNFSKSQSSDANMIDVPYIDVHDLVRNSNLQQFGLDGENYTFGLVKSLRLISMRYQYTPKEINHLYINT
jgi:hypothetical protein